MIWIEAIATAAGLLCVWLVVRQSIWCWPAGLVQVSLYIIVFYDAKLYSDLILHCIYVVMQFVGWYQWLHGGGDRRALPVSTLRAAPNAALVVLTLAGTAAWGALMAAKTDASLPYGDAFEMAASLVALALQTRKKLESWIYWVAVDIVAIGVFFKKDLYLTTGLYFVFLILSIAGYFTWRKSLVGADAGRPVGSAASEVSADR